MFVLGRDRESSSTGSNYQSPQLQSYGQIKREKKKAKTLALITFNLPYLGEEPKGKLLISRVPRADKAECLRQTEQPSSWLLRRKFQSLLKGSKYIRFSVCFYFARWIYITFYTCFS